MNRKIAIGVLAGALLFSGLLVGVSYGGSPGITEPTVLELKFSLDSAEFFFLKGGGQITLAKTPILDVDGNEVGRQQIACTAAAQTGWICTHVSTIKDGPNTDKGTVVATGVYSGKVSNLAITGGTGAYNNVGGRVRMVDDDGRVTYTLYLAP